MTKRTVVTLFVAALLRAQDAAPPAFEVASVKPAAPGASMKRTTMNTDPGRIDYRTVALGALLSKAYDLKNYQLTGPDWMFTERYDVVATLPPGTSEKQIPLMLRTLLADRFKIAMHRERKVIPVYELSPGKDGFKARPSDRAEDGIRLSMSTGSRKLTGTARLSALADILSAMLDRPVLDATGISGVYDINLEWAPDEREANSLVGMKVAMATRDGKSLGGGESAAGGTLANTLRDTLGLKLEPKKSPVEILIVDSASKIPVEN
jgi:uncharacterized protein (TIGR03435 family)